MSNIWIPEHHRAARSAPQTATTAKEAATIGDSALVVDGAQLSMGELDLMKRAFNVLDQAYPGFMWAVGVTDGILDIRCLDLDGQWGYTIHHCNTYSASDLDKRVRNAGGEILERYRQRRARIDHDSIASLPTNFRGLHTPDL